MKTTLISGVALITIGAIILDTTILKTTGIISIILGSFLLLTAPMVADFIKQDKK